MSVKLLTEIIWSLLSLKGGCTGSYELTLVKMPHCWKLHVMAQSYDMPGHEKTNNVVVCHEKTQVRLGTSSCLHEESVDP